VTRHGDLATEFGIGHRRRVEDVIAAGLTSFTTQFTRATNAASSSGTATPVM